MFASDTLCSYPNGHTITKQPFKLQLTTNNTLKGNQELGIFEAEKYFNGLIDEQLLTTSTSHKTLPYPSNRQRLKHEPVSPIYPSPKSETQSSIRSESSWNNNMNHPKQKKKKKKKKNKNHKGTTKTGFRSLLAILVCNCNDKDSVEIITEVEPNVKAGDLSPKTKWLRADEGADRGVNVKGEDCFSFPVLKPSRGDEKCLKLLEVERKCKKYDTESDTSSDLFELESFSTTENNFGRPDTMEHDNEYAPSEASVEWSVVTASVSEFSAPRRLAMSGIVSGCGRSKTRGSRDGGSIRGREWWQLRVDSGTGIAKIQADKKLIGGGS